MGAAQAFKHEETQVPLSGSEVSYGFKVGLGARANFLHFLIKSFDRKLVRAPARPISGFGFGRSSGPGGFALSLGPGRLAEIVYIIHTLVRLARRPVQCIFT